MTEKEIKERCFEDLPPRVIVHDILTYIKASDSWTGEFVLFGYFKKDRFRHRWFIFRSVEIGRKNYDTIIDFSKVRELSLDYYTKELLTILVSKSSRMTSLNFLYLSNLEDILEVSEFYVESISMLFSNQRNFPALHELIIVSDESVKRRVDTSPWIKSKDLFSRLTQFDVTCLLGIENKNLFETKGFLANCRDLFLEKVFFPSEVTLHLPCVVKISLSECRNIKVVSGQAIVETVSLKDVSPQTIQFLLDSFESVKLLHLYYRQSGMGSLQFSEIPWIRHSLKKVTENLYIRGINGFEAPIHFSKTLTDLAIGSCEELDANIFTQEFPTLENLSIDRSIFRVNVFDSDRIWSVCGQLKSLELKSVTNITPHFFQLNTFDNLERLDFYNSAIEEKRMNLMPKLKVISISQWISNSRESQIPHPIDIFPLEGFPSLEDFSIRHYSGNNFNHDRLNVGGKKSDEDCSVQSNNIFQLIGRNTSEFRKLDISLVKDLSDDCFEKCSWENLESLRLSRLSILTGKNLLLHEMEKLEDLEIEKMENFSDEFFMRRRTHPSSQHHRDTYCKNLSSITLWQLPIHGRNWDFLSSDNVVKTMYIYRLKEFTGEIFTKVDFPLLETLSICRSPKLTGKNWKSFPSLQFLDIECFKDNNDRKNEEHNEELFDFDIFLYEHEEISKTLECLRVSPCYNFTGAGIERGFVFSKLTEVTFRDCKRLTDGFFSKNFFPELIELELDNCESIEGKNWNKLPRIEELTFEECESLADEVFQGGVLECLCKMKIKRCGLIEGKGWCFFRSLRKFTLKFLEKHESTTPVFSVDDRPFPTPCSFRRTQVEDDEW